MRNCWIALWVLLCMAVPSNLTPEECQATCKACICRYDRGWICTGYDCKEENP